MNQSLSPAELEQRFAEINAREPEELTAEEAAALAEAEAAPSPWTPSRRSWRGTAGNWCSGFPAASTST